MRSSWDRHALAHANAFRHEIAGLLEQAIAAGELRPCPTQRLARTIHTAYNGTLVTWAIDRDGNSKIAFTTSWRSCSHRFAPARNPKT